MASIIKCTQSLTNYSGNQNPIEAVYPGSDALLQVVGLSRPPQVLKPKLRRLYANINLYLLDIAKLTHGGKNM